MSTPDWVAAWPGLRLSLERRDERLDRALWAPVSPRLAAVLAWSAANEEALTWISEETRARWGVEAAAIETQAVRNLDSILRKTVLREERLGGAPVLLLDNDDWLKASLLLAPGLKGVVAPILGWPVFAIAPCRDFLLLFGEPGPELQERLAGVVAHELESTDDPLSAEILRVDDQGFGAIGEFHEG